jgi:C4-dicarboxylate transporter DctM subunit
VHGGLGGDDLGSQGNASVIHLALAGTIMLVLMLGGVWVAVSLGLAGAYGLTQLLSFDRMILILGKMQWQQSTNFILIALPLFILMGEMMLQAGIMHRVYDAASKLVAALPGGLLQTNIAASMIFASCTGSSLASAATIGSVGYPQIKKRGYDAPLALGSIAAGGTLGILIPPSVIFIIYGTLAEVSIGKLFLAGVFPGIVLGLGYSVYIAIRVLANPSLAPREPWSSGREVRQALISLWPIYLLVVVVLGGMYGGVGSPTEVAGVAALITFGFAAVERKLTYEVVVTACMNTVKQTCMIMLVIIMAKVVSLVLIYARVPDMVMELVNSIGLSAFTLVLFAILLYLIMGMFFDGMSMMVITIPFLLPVMQAANVDLVWLGVIICITIEVGLLTPPVGLNLYVMQGSTGEPFGDIVEGSLPFVGVQILMIALLMVYPPLATYLPDKLF